MARGGPFVGLAIVALALPVSVTSARGQDVSPISLIWDAPAECPSGAAVEEQVRSLLGGTAAPDDRRVRAKGRVGQSATNFHVTLETEIEGVQGMRKLEGDTCASLVEAVALILALAVNPTRVAPRPPPTAPIRLPFRVPASPPIPPPDAKLTRSQLRVSVALAGALFAGPAPAPLYGGRIFAGLALRNARLDFVGASTNSHTFHTAGPTGGRFTMLSGGLRACITPRAVGLTHLLPNLCLGGEAVDVRAEAVGPADTVTPRANHGTWVQGVASIAELVTFVRGVALRFDLDFVVPFQRREFVIEGPLPLPVHHVSEIGYSASLGIQVSF